VSHHPNSVGARGLRGFPEETHPKNEDGGASDSEGLLRSASVSLQFLAGLDNGKEGDEMVW